MAEEDKITEIPARQRTEKKRCQRFMLPTIIALLLIIGGGSITWAYLHHPDSPVPKKISKSVSFPVYYPNPKLLPAGYTLNTKSFSSGDGVVVYSVNNSNGKKIAFTVQSRPSDQDINGFYKAHMPLSFRLQTNNGEVAIGVINKLNVYSLPTKDAWLIISTTLQLQDNQIKALINSLTRP